MDIQFLIDKLEKLVKDSGTLPLSRKRLVDEPTILELIDQIRTAIPEEVRLAKQIGQQRDRVIAQGKEEANRIIEIARKQASELLTSHEVIRAAEARSHTIIERAQREATEIRRGADGYAEQVLTVLEERIAHAHHQIRSGLVELGRRHEVATSAGATTAEGQPADDGVPPSNSKSEPH